MAELLAVLTLPLKRPLITSNDQRRAHWTTVAKAKADTELLVEEAIKKIKLKKIEGPITVRLVWYAPDARVRDTDSLYPMMKAILDALVKKEIIPDDNGKIVYESTCGPIVIARDNPRMEVHIRRVEPVEGGSPLRDG